MLCATSFATHVCSNAGGTSCTKVAVSIPRITSASTCSSSDLVLLTKPEYDALLAKDLVLTTSTNGANALAGTANTSANAALVQIAQGLNLKVLPYEATPDDYAAITAIFVVALAAGAAIWGVKQILKILRNPSEA